MLASSKRVVSTEQFIIGSGDGSTNQSIFPISERVTFFFLNNVMIVMRPVDYRCEGVRLLVSARCVTITNADSLSSS
jgi:hypothetical protein